MKHIYFPINNLNSQGWITDFITSKINRNPKDQLAEAFYGTVDHKSKIFSVNPKFYDEIQIRSLTPPKKKEPKIYAQYVKFMSNLRPEQAAALYPKLILNYVYQRDKKSKRISIPFPFKLSTDIDSILENAFSRGDGAGIKDMSVKREFKYLGEVMNVEVDMSFYFQSMSTFTKETSHKRLPLNTRFSFIKLISALKSNEKIELEYGWGVSPGVEPSLIPPLMIEAIKKYETKKFYLHYKSHDLSFEKDGSIGLRASYFWSGEAGLYAEAELTDLDKKKIAGMDNIEVSKKQKKILKKVSRHKESVRRLELALKNSKKKKTLEDNNILEKFVEPTRTSNTKIQRVSLASRRLARGPETTDDKIKKLRRHLSSQNKKINTLNRSIRQGLSGFIIDNLILEQRMFHVDFNTKKEDALKDNIYTANADISKILYVDGKKGIFKIKTVKDKVNVEKLDKAYTLMYDKIFNVSSKGKTFGAATFFSFRSLAEIVLSLLNKEQTDKLPLICLGNVTARSSDHEYTINIGDVLIETRTFQKWFYDNFIRTDLSSIVFVDFLQSAMDDLIPTALNENLVLDNSQTRIGVIKKTFLMFEGEAGDPIFRKLYETTDYNVLGDFLERTNKANQAASTPMVVYHEVKTVSTPLNSPYFSKIVGKVPNFNEARDAEKGIPHVKIGADDGLLINASFAATTIPGIRSGVWHQARQDALEGILSDVYTANLSLIGNNIFFKGGFFAVPSNPMGGRAGFDPGIVGYYAMTSLTDSIDSNGSYTSQVSGPWQDNPEARKRNTDKARFKEKIDTSKMKDRTKHLSSYEYLRDFIEANTEIGDNVGLNDEAGLKKIKKFIGFK